MTRSSKSVIFKLFVLMLIFCILGGGVWYFVQRDNEKERVYDQQVKELQGIIEGATVEVYCAKESLKAGSIIGQNDVVREVIMTDQSGFITQADMGKVLLVDVPAGTGLMKFMVSEEYIDTGLREVEYDWINISSNVEEADYVDVRILYPDGTDYCILSKKQIKNLSETKLVCDLWNSEEELLLLDSASVDAYLYPGSHIYVTKYILPFVQEPSVVNYTPSEQIIELINSDPNIVNVASRYLSEEYRKRLEGRMSILFSEAVNDYVDENGVYLGKPTDAEQYAETIFDSSTISGSELPREYGESLWE